MIVLFITLFIPLKLHVDLMEFKIIIQCMYLFMHNFNQYNYLTSMVIINIITYIFGKKHRIQYLQEFLNSHA